MNYSNYNGESYFEQFHGDEDEIAAEALANAWDYDDDLDDDEGIAEDEDEDALQ
jgi:hypothetical protein